MQMMVQGVIRRLAPKKIRTNSFRELWWEGINRFLSPDAVVIVDSASPGKPNNLESNNHPLQNIVLLTNPGHSTETNFHYSGWTASVILSLEYAYFPRLMFFYMSSKMSRYGNEIKENCVGE